MSQYFDGEASGGAGAVDSVNGQTGVVVLTKSSVGLGNVDNTSDVNKPISSATQTALDGKAASVHSHAIADVTGLQGALDGKEPEINASNNQVIYQNASDVREGFPGFFRSSSGGISFYNNLALTNSGGYAHHNFGVDLNPTENSPTTATNLLQLNANIDTGSDGFDLGVGGQALRMMSNSISHQGTSDIGTIEFFNNYFNIGNGTDPISCNGAAYMFGFGEFNSGVTIDGPIQGYGFQPVVDLGASVTSNCYINAFYDFSDINVPVNSYQSFAASPQLEQINNNSGFTGLNINPSITTFDGNAGFTAIGIAGTLGTFGTGGYTGININSTVTDVDNATGLYVNMDNVNATNSKYAIFTEGNVQINGSLSFSGGLSIGQLNAFAAQELADGGGNPASVHFLVSSPFIGDNETIANADIIGVNTAALINIGANSAVTTAFLGLAALGLPAVVTMASGSTVDRVAGAVFALSLDAGGTGGTINELSLCRAVSIPNGATTVTRQYGYEFDNPFGDVGVTNWGFYTKVAAHNYFRGDLLIGGTPLSDDIVTNSNVALEIKSTTKALVVSRMTTTQRNAMTAIDGMIIYNTVDERFQGYRNGSWVDFH